MSDAVILHTGKKPATYDPHDLRYADIRPKDLETILPNIPKPHGGFGMDFSGIGWRMLGNGSDDSVFPGFKGAGDCFWAGQGHSVMEADHNAGRPIAPITGESSIADYSDYVLASTGQPYDRLTGANDTGTDVRDGLKRHQKIGIHDDAGAAHQIGPYFSLEPGNFQHMWEVLWLAECLGVGLSPFPQSAVDQFNNGQTWTYVPGFPGEDGHWIIVVGHPLNNVWTGVTWARRQTMTPPFLSHFNDELWAWIDRERYNQRTGETFEGIAGADVERYLALEAQAVANVVTLR